MLDADDDEEAVHRFRIVDNLLYDDDELVADGELLLAADEEPTTYAEAAGRKEWKQAMSEELRSIADNKTWTLTDAPPGKKSIGLKWVFKIKRDGRQHHRAQGPLGGEGVRAARRRRLR
jgi:hypothetical protein